MKGLIGKLFIKGEILLKTGLHIGGSKEGLDIGGVDVPILRDVNDVPFIPGSSLKGKMRSLLEWRDGKFTIKLNNDTYDSISKFWDKYLELKKERRNIDIKASPCTCGECNICRLFGTSAQENVISPSRLIVRDALLNITEFERTFKDKEFLERDYGEVKFENTIDRITSMANPRQIERVPAGAVFDFTFIVNLYGEGDEEAIKTLFSGMNLLEDDYLGGSGTRGYGEIEFKNIDIFLRTKEYYISKAEEISILKESNLKNVKIDDIWKKLSEDLLQEKEKNEDKK